MRKFEYKRVDYGYDYPPTEDHLQVYGQDGWEVVCLLSNCEVFGKRFFDQDDIKYVLYLKREIFPGEF